MAFVSMPGFTEREMRLVCGPEPWPYRSVPIQDCCNVVEREGHNLKGIFTLTLKMKFHGRIPVMTVVLCSKLLGGGCPCVRSRLCERSLSLSLSCLSLSHTTLSLSLSLSLSLAPF